MDLWTAIAWGVASLGGALIFLRLVADGLLIVSIGLKHREHAALRAERQRQEFGNSNDNAALAA